MTNTSEFVSWSRMKARCYDKTHRAYKWYGALGIRVCKRWRGNFSAFLSDMGPKPSPKHTLERKNGKLNYQPSNCRWATMKEQQRNRKSNRIVRFRGKKMPLICAVELSDIPYGTVHSRLSLGWSIDEALSKPSQQDGSLLSLCKNAGANYGMVSSRVRKHGWTVERALTERSKAGPHSLRARCIAAGLEYKAVHLRITRYGWTEADALSTPVRKTKRRVH